jgi:hypothetical protein
MSKSIYTFNIEKIAKITEKRQEKYTDESGIEKERSISETVEKSIPIEILIRQPNRKHNSSRNFESHRHPFDIH